MLITRPRETSADSTKFPLKRGDSYQERYSSALEFPGEARKTVDEREGDEKDILTIANRHG